MAKGEPNKGRSSTEATIYSVGATGFIEGGAGDDILIGTEEAEDFMLFGG